MAVLHKTPIEKFVEAFVKQTKNVSVGLKHIQKAEALIDEKLGFCCDNPNGTLNLHTPYDNLFTNTIRMYLKTMTKDGNVHSLNRTKTLLEIFRQGICNYCS